MSNSFLYFFDLWLGVACALVASSKRRSPVGWLFLGTLLPLISLLALFWLGEGEPIQPVPIAAAQSAPPRMWWK